MKALITLLCSLCLAVGGYAQAPVAAGDTQAFAPQELEQLLGPIALYPDPLISLILPASTTPSDVVMADRYIIQGGDPSQIPNEPWDDSVKALTHYPDVLKWLDQNLDWTTQLGSAYLAQPADVMNAIQQLRAEAKANGALTNTDQQQVVMDDGNLLIEPTSPDTVYVPQYDPDAVYDDGYTVDDGPLITFDSGYPVGPWLYFWPDWRHRGIYFGDWRRWRDRGRPGFAEQNAHPWHANPDRIRAQYQIRSSNVARQTVARPQALPGVAVIHSKNSVPHPGYAAAPSRDFTGRGAVSPRAVARPVVVEPTTQPGQSVYTGYGRGDDARAASERGQFSRQSYGVTSRPVVPAAPVAPIRAPVQPMQNFARPAAPMVPSTGGGVGSGGGGRSSGGGGRFGR